MTHISEEKGSSYKTPSSINDPDISSEAARLLNIYEEIRKIKNLISIIKSTNADSNDIGSDNDVYYLHDHSE